MPDREGSSSVVLWLLLAVVSLGILLGGSAFYYFAVHLPRSERAEKLHTIELDIHTKIKSAMMNNAYPDVFVTTDRETYDGWVTALKDIQNQIRSVGGRPRHLVPPPYVVPPKRRN